jgi:hypothetical protein
MQSRQIRLQLLLLGVCAVVIAGCAAPVHRQVPEIRRDAGKPTTIVLMPLDVELSQLTAGGVEAPHAEWTEAALKHMRAALETEAKKRNVTLVDYQPERGSTQDQAIGLELIKLHRAVGGAVLMHQYFPAYALPSKEGKLDWSLGPSVDAISRSHEADYAMFLYVRDSYATAGRAAVIVAFALLGAGVPGGSQVGFASVVDLKTGDIAWFNRLIRQTGDLRTPEAAAETVKALVADSMK